MPSAAFYDAGETFKTLLGIARRDREHAFLDLAFYVLALETIRLLEEHDDDERFPHRATVKEAQQRVLHGNVSQPVAAVRSTIDAMRLERAAQQLYAILAQCADDFFFASETWSVGMLLFFCNNIALRALRRLRKPQARRHLHCIDDTTFANLMRPGDLISDRYRGR